MNMKVIGAIATIASFGVGMLIPNVSGSSVDSYEEALAIVEGTGASGKEQAEEKKEAGLAKDNETTTETEVSEEKEQTADNSSIDPDADVVFDWTFDDIKINGIKLVASDYDSVVDSFGLDKTMVEYTDSGFKINYDGYEYNGKVAWLNGSAVDANGKTTSLYWDGSKYVDDQLEEREPDRKTISLSGSCEDRDNSSDYWSFGYFTSSQNNRLQEHIWIDDYKNGLSGDDEVEISNFLAAPFIGGDYNRMNTIFHTEELIEKGLKDESDTSQGAERYIVDTSIGKCIFQINTSDSNGTKKTNYSYSFDDKKYRIDVSFTDGIDFATGIYYGYFH
jgi:hypothetical protein